MAVRHYFKPESLLYTLLTLHRYEHANIQTCFIEDDTGIREHQVWLASLAPLLEPWELCVVAVPDRLGIGEVLPDPSSYRSSLRYQIAMDRTTSPYLLVIHDDVRFLSPFTGSYIDAIDSDVCAVGQLGTCWCACPMKDEGCTPEHIGNQDYPRLWPVPQCRPNEWCCMVNMATNARVQERGTFFGAFYHCTDPYAYQYDIGCRWFTEAWKLGYRGVHRSGDGHWQHSPFNSCGNAVWEHGEACNRDAVLASLEHEFEESMDYVRTAPCPD